MARLIEGYVSRLTVPAGQRDVLVFDDTLPGFGIRKFASGRATYIVKYNVGPQQRRHSLGPVVHGNLKAMRLEASAILAKARLGRDVAAEKRAAASKNTITLGEIVPRYLEARASELRPKTLSEVTRYIERSFKRLHKQPVDGVTRQHIVSVIDDLETANGKVAADRARTALSAFFAWAIDRGYLDANPTLNIKARAGGESRVRVLSLNELAEVWEGCADDDYGHIVQLLILTGQRRNEIGELGLSEYNAEARQIDLPAARTKNNRPHIVPLSDEAIAILRAIPRRQKRDLVFGSGAGGFGGWSKSKAALDARILDARRKVRKDAPTMPDWTVHDIRRSFVTHMNEEKVALPHVIEAIVNHISGHLAGVAGVYNKAQYLAERRQALDLWGERIAALVAGRENTIVPFRAANKL
jgi:integrase